MLWPIPDGVVDSALSSNSLLVENKVLFCIRHPNIAEIYGLCVKPNGVNAMQAHLVTESSSHCLADIVDGLRNSQQYSFPFAISIAMNVARGVQYLHSHRPPVAHGSIHSKTVLCDEWGKGVMLVGLESAYFNGK